MIYFTKQVYERMQVAGYLRVAEQLHAADEEILAWYKEQGRDRREETMNHFALIRPLLLRYLPETIVRDIECQYIRETEPRTAELSAYAQSWAQSYEEEWNVLSRSCHEQFLATRDTLPASFAELAATYSFHDARIVSATRPQLDELTIELDCKGCLMPFLGEGRLTFRGIREAVLPDDPVGDCWLYEEYHLTTDGLADFRALLHANPLARGPGDYMALHELRIVAEEVRFTETAASSCPLKEQPD